MKRAHVFVAAALATVIVAGPAAAEMMTVEGTAGYRERIAMHPDAVLDVQLVDISRADAKAIVLSSMRIKSDGRVPVPFQLQFDDRLIDPRFTYAIQAKLVLDNDVLFRTTTVHPVAPLSGDSVEVTMMKMPASEPGSEAMADPAMLVGKTWVAEDIGGMGVLDALQSTIMFGDDGAVNGNAGCNAFSGAAEIDGASLVFGPLAATQKACTPAVNDQEQKFFAALGQTGTYALVGDALELRDADGAPLMRLMPSG